MKPWLDEWELQPGTIWQYELEKQIENIGAAAVFVGQNGLGPWQSEEIYAILQEFIRRKCPVIPVMLSDAPKKPELPIFLKNRHWVDFRQQQPDPLAQLIWGVVGRKPEADSNVGRRIQEVRSQLANEQEVYLHAPWDHWSNWDNWSDWANAS